MEHLNRNIFILFSIWIVVNITTAEKITPKEDLTYRLPNYIRPMQYTIELVPKITEADEFKFNGVVNIDIYSTDYNIQQIVLHAERLTYKTIELTNPIDPNDKFKITIDSSDEKHQFLKLYLDKYLVIFQRYVLTIEFSGTLWNDMHGFYKSVYKDEKNKDVYLAATQFEATFARRAFPCFDEPSFKAKFHITLKHDVKMTATLSNMDEESSVVKNDDPDTKITKFQLSEPMPTYIVAFIVSNFAYKEDPSPSNPKHKVRVYARSEAISQVDHAVYICDKLLTYLEKYTEMEFPYKTYLVAIPDFAAGAMENWGLITYRENALLYDEEDSTKSNKLRVSTVISHELVHMWFGDMITLNWWENTWLNEGFARYFQYFATAKVIGEEWGLEDSFTQVELQSIFALDAYGNMDALSSPVSTPAEIRSRFNLISYNKGASVIRMMQQLIGEESFKKGIQNYLKSLQFKNAEPHQLFMALNEQITSESIKDGFYSFFKTFTTQSGYPLVTVTKTSDNTIVVDQEVFLLNNGDKTKQKWTIPLTMTHGMNGVFERVNDVKYLMENEQNKTISIENVNLDKTWIILNLQQIGYYRVNYDDSLWKNIIDVLVSDRWNSIHTLNRAQLIDDIFNLAKADLVQYDQVFNLIDYLHQETSSPPWSSAITNLNFLKLRLIGNVDIHKIFVTHVRDNLIANAYNKMKNFEEDAEKEAANVTMYRAKIVNAACEYETEDCVQKSIDLFKKWKDDKVKIPVDLRGTVYCTGIHNGNEDDWNHLWNAFTNANVAAEQVRIMESLGCSINNKILKQYLEKTIAKNSEIRSQDALTAFTSVLKSQVGIEVALDFFKHNTEAIKNSYGGLKPLGDVVHNLGSKLTTEEQIEEFEGILNELTEKPEYEDVAVISKQTIQTARTNLEWNTKYEDQIHNVIKSKINNSNNADSIKTSLMSLMLLFVGYFFKLVQTL